MFAPSRHPRLAAGTGGRGEGIQGFCSPFHILYCLTCALVLALGGQGALEGAVLVTEQHLALSLYLLSGILPLTPTRGNDKISKPPLAYSPPVFRSAIIVLYFVSLCLWIQGFGGL